MANPMFVGQGHFSHVNTRLREALQPELGPMSWYDARQALAGPLGLSLGVSAVAVRRPEFVLQPRRLFRARILTTPTFDLMSRAARDHANRLDPAYVFQTQGFFDGHLDDRPFFVYTDYTELANLRGRRDHKLMPERWLRRERRLYERADLIFAASSTTQESLDEDYAVPDAKVILTHIGINAEIPPSVPDRAEHTYNILFVGLEWERKGGPDVLRAFERLRSQVPTATLTIVGCRPGPRPPRGVQYVGKVPLRALPRYLAAASVFCLPAHHEPAGIAYSEAAAWGLPVIASTAGDIADRVLDGRTGYLVAPGDVDALHDALLRLAADPPLRVTLGRAGRTHVLANFTWPRVAEKIAAAVRTRIGLKRDANPADPGSSDPRLSRTPES
jgi:glycosyltransferase involved in cell wall biosynthesis